jgi:hypothetical protein
MADPEMTTAANETVDLDSGTTMSLTGVHSALAITVAGQGGTLAVAAAVAGQNGYKIESANTAEGLAYTVVSVVTAQAVAEPPTLVVSVDYAQTAALAEVDLDVRYTDLPPETMLQIAASQASFNISKQPVSGSGLLGSSGKKLGAFATSIDIRLWIARPQDILAGSSLTLSMNKITGGSGGPVQKTLLQKIVLNLSN